MKAGAQIAIVEMETRAERGINPHRPNSGDLIVAAPANVSAPQLFAASNETGGDGQSKSRQEGLAGTGHDSTAREHSRDRRREALTNILLLIIALTVGAAIVTRLLDSFGHVIGPFR